MVGGSISVAMSYDDAWILLLCAPGTQMTLVSIGKDLALKGSTTKIEDKQVPGIDIVGFLVPVIPSWPVDPFPGDLKKKPPQVKLQSFFLKQQNWISQNLPPELRWFLLMDKDDTGGV